ncbi:DUF4054 domain-containing protein [Rhodanobacter glycinis]|uniref:DUF4054 domain-containing protein n=1 Tax=Rhodanobacter glycinis TaxID=582702 RepID=A0A5B9DY89_9GAMM|nr:DUF4054 domain-containing protein [Rhodanobacter glycinis]QEE24519.1 DUF4054 domain-containing protein [Rhodanobacter glycinis]
MPITTDQFRIDFPEFADSSVYSDAVISFWLGIAAVSLSECRWGAWWGLGQELFTAHNIVLAAQSVEDASLGITPGEVDGPATAKSVDKVSVSKDASAVTLEDGGFWNMTRYGIQLLQFARMVGSGGIQFGGC